MNKINEIVKKVIMLLLVSLRIPDSIACLILFITDGKEVLVANHEDWYASDAEVTFVPASKGKFGMIYFDFASEGTAQGGMNTAGLFFDGTATPRAPYPENQRKKDCNCYIWTKILQECATVEQAIQYAKTYRIPEIERVHVLFADSAGHSAIIGVYDGKLQVKRNSHNDKFSHQLLTNFNITNPSYGGEKPCKRFQMADAMLKTDSSATIQNLTNILSKTHQDSLTVYSNIYNLTKKEVYVFSKRNFSRPLRIDINNELSKGKHSILVTQLK